MKTITYSHAYRKHEHGGQGHVNVNQSVEDYVSQTINEGDESAERASKATGRLCQILADRGLLQADDIVYIVDQKWVDVDARLEDRGN